MTSTIKNVDANTDANAKTSLYELAKGLTSMDYLVIPVVLRIDIEKDGSSKKRKSYCIEWSEEKRGRDRLLSEAELLYWFGYMVDNSGSNGKCRADGIAIALSGKNVEGGPLSLAMDTDGAQATNEYEEEFLPRCSEEIQDAHRKTTLTHTPSGGKHWLLGINRADYPDGLPQSATWCDIRIELANQSHSQINLLGTRHILNEYLPGYSNIRRIESRVILSKKATEEYLRKLRVQEGDKHPYHN